MNTLIVAVIIITLVTIFSIQNATPMAIAFLFWKFQASVAIAIFLSTLCGVVTGAIVMYVIMKKTSGTKKEDRPKL